MLRQRADQALLATLCAVDLAVTAVCWVGAYFLRVELSFFPAPVDMPPSWWCIRALPLVLGAAFVAYHVGGLYQIGRRWPIWQEIAQVVKATAIMLLLWLAANFYLRDPYTSRLVTLLFWCTTVVGLIAVRRLFGVYFKLRRREGRGSPALIVGAGRTARQLARALRLNNWLGVTPLGYVDDDRPYDLERAPRTVGSMDDLPRLVEEHGIEYVFVALPLDRYAETRRIFRLLRNTLVEVRLVPDVPNLASMDVQLHELEGMPVLSLQANPHGFLGAVVKRAMDVALSLIGLIVLSPFLLAIAAIVKLGSPGPVFFLQERMGLNGHRFKMVKFRTMRINAESETGPVWAKAGDDRRTHVGAFLRATSIDELPQLFNVLVGDMSLVGPRPERPYFIEKFRATIPHYMLRHAVKAGITGWAQVHGWRGNTSLRKRVQYDLYYIANWSPWLDLRILFQTVFKVMWDKNAY